MAEPTFFQVLKTNLKCAFCRKKACPVRYNPKRMKSQLSDGIWLVTRCEKDEKAHLNGLEKSFKRRLP